MCAVRKTVDLNWTTCHQEHVPDCLQTDFLVEVAQRPRINSLLDQWLAGMNI